MANRKNTFLLKRSNVVNKSPSLGDIQLGELALNTADAKLFSTYTGGLTGATEIREIGWDRLSTISGGTVNGSISATTFYGDGSNLTGISSDNFYVTGFTYNDANTFTISRNGGLGDLTSTINTVTGLTINGNLDVNGQTVLSSSTQNTLTVIGSGSTNPLFLVQGSTGELFSITDSLTGTLFSVNDISGLPILEVNSDDEILMGSYQAPSLNTTFKTSITAGLTELYSIPVSAYTGGFFEYTLTGAGARTGSIMSIFSGSSVNYTETTTTDIGDTSPVTFDMNVSGGTANLTVSATTGTWEIKTIVRSI